MFICTIDLPMCYCNNPYTTVPVLYQYPQIAMDFGMLEYEHNNVCNSYFDCIIYQDMETCQILDTLEPLNVVQMEWIPQNSHSDCYLLLLNLTCLWNKCCICCYVSLADLTGWAYCNCQYRWIILLHSLWSQCDLYDLYWDISRGE